MVGQNVSCEIVMCWGPAAQHGSISPTLLRAGGWFPTRSGRAGREGAMSCCSHADRTQSWQIGRTGVHGVVVRFVCTKTPFLARSRLVEEARRHVFREMWTFCEEEGANPPQNLHKTFAKPPQSLRKTFTNPSQNHHTTITNPSQNLHKKIVFIFLTRVR